MSSATEVSKRAYMWERVKLSISDNPASSINTYSSINIIFDKNIYFLQKVNRLIISTVTTKNIFQIYYSVFTFNIKNNNNNRTIINTTIKTKLFFKVVTVWYACFGPLRKVGDCGTEPGLKPGA